MLTGFPSPHDDDSEDVAWGLTTGSALWKQGERYDAIVWLKRAVDAATEAGQSTRADELNRAATDLIASLAAPAPAPLARQQSAPPAPAPLAPLTPAPAAPEPSAPALPVQLIAPKLAPASAPPRPPPGPARKGPMPPKPPPPPRSKSSASKLELPPPRAPLPSVTTSAPPLEELTNHPAAKELPHEPAPPPTITPEVESAPPAPAALVAPAPAPLEPLVDDARAADVEVATATPELAAPPEAHDTSEAPELTGAPEPAAAPESELEAPFFLGALEASGELTDEQRKALFRTVTIESIAADEELKVTGLALVIDGLVSVQATVSDVAAGTLKAGEALYARSSIPDTMTLRLVAESDPTKVALWDLDAVDAALAGSSALLEGLMAASNRIQAIAGCTMGPLGDRLDEGLRTSAIERLEVRVLQPNEIVATAGLPVPGMIIVGVGSLELGQDGERLGPGDFLFAREVLGGETAPTTTHAGAKGAIIFFGARALAQELLVTCPPLLEIFAGM